MEDNQVLILKQKLMQFTEIFRKKYPTTSRLCSIDIDDNITSGISKEVFYNLSAPSLGMYMYIKFNVFYGNPSSNFINIKAGYQGKILYVGDVGYNNNPNIKITIARIHKYENLYGPFFMQYGIDNLGNLNKEPISITKDQFILMIFWVNFLQFCQDENICKNFNVEYIRKNYNKKYVDIILKNKDYNHDPIDKFIRSHLDF